MHHDLKSIILASALTLTGCVTPSPSTTPSTSSHEPSPLETRYQHLRKAYSVYTPGNLDHLENLMPLHSELCKILDSANVCFPPDLLSSIHEDVAHGYLYKYNYSDAISHFKQSFALKPTTSTAFFCARALYESGDIQQAYEYIQRCYQVHPFDYPGLDQTRVMIEQELAAKKKQ